MPTFVQREIAATWISVRVVFLETMLDVIRFRFNRDPYAHANIVRNFSTVRFERRDHFDHALLLQHAAF